MTAARKTGLLRFSASRCLALIVKEWHQIGRDPSALVIGVFLPLFMLLVCGFGISMDMKDVPVAIVLEERTPVAQRIAVDFTANPYFDAKVFYAKAPAEKALEAREVECILTIPAGFAANAQQGEAAELGLTVYGVDSNSATLFKSYVLGQLNSSVTKMVSNGMIEPAVASRVSAGPVKSLASRSWFNEASISTWYLVPGILVIVVGAASTMMSAIVIAREWERGTFESLFVTPMKILELILAKTIPYFVIAMLGMVLCLVVGRVLYDLPMRGSLVLILGESMLYLVVALGIGLVISGLTKNQFLACHVSLMISFLPSVVLTGFLFDLHAEPMAIRVVSSLIPTTYYLELMKSLFLSGNYWPLIVRDTAVLLAFALFFLGWAFRITRKKVEP